MSLKNYLSIIFISCFVYNLQSQESTQISKINNKETSFSLSIFGGISLLGPSVDFRSNLRKAGFDATSSSMFGTSKHPRTSRLGIYKIEGTYYFSNKKGISIHIGQSDNIEVFGFKEPVLTIIFESKIQEVALKYVMRSNDSKSDFHLGLVYLSHKVINDSFLMQDSSDFTNDRVGIIVGVNQFLLDKKNYFIALSGDFRWAAKSNVPVMKLTYQNLNDEIPAAKINLATLNFGISIGFRI